MEWIVDKSKVMPRADRRIAQLDAQIAAQHGERVAADAQAAAQAAAPVLSNPYGWTAPADLGSCLSGQVFIPTQVGGGVLAAPQSSALKRAIAEGDAVWRLRSAMERLDVLAELIEPKDVGAICAIASIKCSITAALDHLK